MIGDEVVRARRRAMNAHKLLCAMDSEAPERGELRAVITELTVALRCANEALRAMPPTR